MAHLALDDSSFAFARVSAPQLHQFECGKNWRQRIAEFVAEHRKEFVLGAIGRFSDLTEVLNLLPRSHLFRDVRGDDEYALDLALDIPERRVEKVEVHPFR